MSKVTSESINRKMWGYFSPDGYLQVRSIADTKKESRKFLPMPYSETTYKEYEKKGFYLKRILVNIKPINLTTSKK